MDADRLAETVTGIDDRNPLTALDSVRAARAEIQRLEAVLVRRARNDGASWAEIAIVLGVSKQAVHKRYGTRS